MRSLFFSIIFCFSLTSFGQRVDTLDLENTTDFYYQTGDSTYIFVKTNLDSISISKANVNDVSSSFEYSNKIVKFYTPKNKNIEYGFHVIRNSDTIDSFTLYPAVKTKFDKGFGVYDVNKILNPGSYYDIITDSTSKGKKLSINGRKIEIKANDLFSIYAFNAKSKKFEYSFVEIGADTLIFKRKLHLPGANVLINARVIIVENFDGPILDVTPIKNGRELLVDKYEKGEDGRNADTLRIFYDTLICSKAYKGKLFIANGGDGQNAPIGKNGQNFPTVTNVSNSITVKAKCDYFPKKRDLIIEIPNNENSHLLAELVVIKDEEIQKEHSAKEHESVTTHNCRYNGINSSLGFLNDNSLIQSTKPIIGGRPGEPGNGGVIICNKSITEYSEIKGGNAGEKDIIRVGGKKSGILNPYKLQVNINKKNNFSYTWAAQMLPDDISLEPLIAINAVGKSGVVSIDTIRNKWANINYIKFIINYALDLYRFGHVDESRKIFEIYKKQYFDVSITNISSRDSLLKDALSKTTNEALIKMNANLDYYGNSYGFVPGMDFVQNFQSYKNSIHNLARTYTSALYLERQYKKEDSRYKRNVDNILDYIESNLFIDEEFQKIENEEIPKLEKQLDSATQYLEQISMKIKNLDAVFKAKAKKIIQKREDKEKDRKFLQTLTSIAKVVPVYQPALGMVATGIEAFALKEPGNNFGDQLSHVVNDYQNIRANKANFDSFKKSFDNVVNDGSSDPIYKKLYNGKDVLGKSVQPYLQSTEKILKSLNSRKVSKESVEAEIAKLKNKHPQYKSLIDSVSIIAEYNQKMVVNISKLTSKLIQLDQKIQHNCQFVSKIKDDVASSILSNSSETGDISIIKDQIIDEILLQQYHFAKAYEYFVLMQYKGYESTYKLLRRDRIEKVINYDSLITSIEGIFLNDITSIATKGINILNSDFATQMLTTKLSIPIEKEDIERLNNNNELKLNLFRTPVYNRINRYLATHQDFLIEDIEIEPAFDTNSSNEFKQNVNWCGTHISISHLGVSTRYNGTEKHNFYHYSKGNANKPFYEWNWDVEILPKYKKQKTVEDQTYLNLINILTDGYSQKTRKLISFDSDFYIRKIDDNPLDKKIKLENLTLDISFVLVPRGSNSGLYLFQTENMSSRIPVSIYVGSTVTQGFCTYYRNFPKESSIDISVPEIWEGKKFSHWQENGKTVQGDNRRTVRLTESIHKIAPIYK